MVPKFRWTHWFDSFTVFISLLLEADLEHRTLAQPGLHEDLSGSGPVPITHASFQLPVCSSHTHLRRSNRHLNFILQ